MAPALLAFCIFIMALSPNIIRFADADALAICFWRMLMATCLLVPIMVFRGGLGQFKLLGRADWLQLLASGSMLFGHFYSFFRAVQETSIANSTILNALSPLFTAAGAYLMFSERISRRLGLAAAFGFAGVVTLFADDVWRDAGSWSGNVWALASGVMFSAYILTGKKVRGRISNLAFTASIYLQTTALSAIAMALKGVAFVGYSPRTWVAYAVLAVVPTILGHAIFTYCLKYLNINFMSCATLAGPVISASIALVLFGEKVTAAVLVGFLLTGISVLVLYLPALLAGAGIRRAT